VNLAGPVRGTEVSRDDQPAKPVNLSNPANAATRTNPACFLIAGLLLVASANISALVLQSRTLQAYDEYMESVRKRFNERVRTGALLCDLAPADVSRGLRNGRVIVQTARDGGIVEVPGGSIFHWRGAAFIPNATVVDAVAVAQDYSNYDHVFDPIVRSRLLEHDGNTFRVLLRIQKSAGLVTAVLDVWSIEHYFTEGPDLVYSSSDSERIQQVQDPGKPDERHLPPDQGKGYLWRAGTFSRYAAYDQGVLAELETIGLSREFPPLLGWIIAPIARQVARSSVEDSLLEFRRAVVTATGTPPVRGSGA
jgi:hypothetical protein